MKLRFRKLVLDTNVYVRAFRDPKSKGRLQDLYGTSLAIVHLSSVVTHELLAAIMPTKALRAIERLVSSFEKRGRIITPSHGAWKRSAEAIARLHRDGRIDGRSITRSFVHDVVLAASCAESGTGLLTHNLRDFRKIREVIPFDLVDPAQDRA